MVVMVAQVALAALAAAENTTQVAAQVIHHQQALAKVITVGVVLDTLQVVAVAVVLEQSVPMVLILLRVQAALEHNPASLEQQHTTQVEVAVAAQAALLVDLVVMVAVVTADKTVQVLLALPTVVEAAAVPLLEMSGVLTAVLALLF